MTLVVRLLAETDIEQATELARRHVAEVIPEKAEFFEPERVRAYFQRATEVADAIAFVVVEGEKVVGYLTASVRGCAFMSGASTTLDAIFVDKGSRGSRAALLLMRAFILWSRSLDVIGIELATSLGHAERDARFFSRFGARKVGWSMRIT